MGLWIVLAIVAFLGMGGAGMLVRLIEGRRRFQLDLKREEARIAEARAKELEIAQRRAELEYREAVLELERFDRRRGTTGDAEDARGSGEPPEPP